MHPNLEQKQTKSLLNDPLTCRKLEFNQRKNEEDDHTAAIDEAADSFCYDLDGKLLWSKTDFPKMQTRAGFGEGSSPTLAGDKILVPWDHEGPSALYALHKLTGDLIWTAKRDDEPTCWATPLVVEANGKSQVLMNGQTRARAYDL
jgi:outer membrane protein assembly factor BamB